MKKIITSLLFCSIGAYFSIGAVIFYKIGSLSKMGPGFFPLALGLFLILLGVLNGVKK